MFWPSAQTPYPNNASFKPKQQTKNGFNGPAIYNFHAVLQGKKGSEKKNLKRVTHVPSPNKSSLLSTI